MVTPVALNFLSLGADLRHAIARRGTTRDGIYDDLLITFRYMAFHSVSLGFATTDDAQ